MRRGTEGLRIVDYGLARFGKMLIQFSDAERGRFFMLSYAFSTFGGMGLLLIL
jgi:hypothetical protein